MLPNKFGKSPIFGCQTGHRFSLLPLAECNVPMKFNRWVKMVLKLSLRLRLLAFYIHHAMFLRTTHYTVNAFRKVQFTMSCTPNAFPLYIFRKVKRVPT